MARFFLNIFVFVFVFVFFAVTLQENPNTMTPIQYILRGNDLSATLSAALSAGCRWVQLAAPLPAGLPLADFLHDCHAAGAYLVLSDDAETCKEVAADGVVLSAPTTTAADSLNIYEARKMLGEDTPQFIGAFVRTVAEAITAAKMGADFLQTDKELCIDIRNALVEHRLTTPVVAVGITGPEEIPALLDAGISGIACDIDKVAPAVFPILLTADES